MKIGNPAIQIDAPVDWKNVVCSENGDVQFQLVDQEYSIAMTSMELVKLYFLIKKNLAGRPKICPEYGEYVALLPCSDKSIKNLRTVEIPLPGRGGAGNSETRAPATNT